MSTTRFLETVSTNPSDDPSYVISNAANVSLLNYSLPTTGSLTVAEAQTLVQEGVAGAIAEASSSFQKDPNFIELFQVNEAQGIGNEDSYISRSRSKTRVEASFDVSENKTLSFDFATRFSIESKEIDNPRAEYSRGIAKTSFLLLDTSDATAEVLGYYGIRGRLVTSEQEGIFRGQVRKNARKNLSNLELTIDSNIDGDDGIDFIDAEVSGRYSKTFSADVTSVTLVQVTQNSTLLARDELAGSFGPEVIYGTLQKDIMIGGRDSDSLYGSLGNDTLKGKQGDDILEGGIGNDQLYGNAGDDRIHGGAGNDTLYSGKGNDILAGGDGTDYFSFRRFQPGDVDTILDFKVGTDKLIRIGSAERASFFDNIVDTDEGARFTASTGGQILFQGVSVRRLSNAGSLFA